MWTIRGQMKKVHVLAIKLAKYINTPNEMMISSFDHFAHRLTT